MIDDDPTLFVHGGREYRGTKSGTTSRRPLEIGGFEETPELTIAINLVDENGGIVFGQDRPSVGDRVTVGIVEYRIDRTEIDSFEECFQMDLRSKNK